MKNIEKPELKISQVENLLKLYLKNRPADKNFETAQAHLNEDTLTAFVEGNIHQREAHPVISHLVDCSFCRHITTELIRLDTAFAESEFPVIINENQPTKVSEVLSGILAKIFGSNEGAVFAHHEEDCEGKEDKETKSE